MAEKPTRLPLIFTKGPFYEYIRASFLVKPLGEREIVVEDFTVEIQQRNQLGSAANRRYRRQGLIPSIVYAHGEAASPVLTSAREFLKQAENASTSQVFTLKSSDKKLDGRPAIIKEVQLDHLKGSVLHLDFQALRDDEEITVRVPLKFTGESVGVKDDGGILSVAAHEIEVVCLPRAIPKSIAVEVTALRIGDSIHAEAVVLPEGVKLAGNSEETIVSVVVVKQVVEETTAVAAEGAAVEGAAADGAPADGAAAAEAAPAKGDKADKGGKK